MQRSVNKSLLKDLKIQVGIYWRTYIHTYIHTYKLRYDMRHSSMCGTVLSKAVYVLGATADIWLQRALYVFLRGDDDIHQLRAIIIISTTKEGIGRDGSGCVDDNIRTAVAGGAAAVLWSHYRQNETESIKWSTIIVCWYCVSNHWKDCNTCTQWWFTSLWIT
jgi:hypothetical protein